MNKTGIIFLVSLLSVLFLPDARGQDTIKIKRYVNAIEFDGRPFEDAWSNLDYFYFTMHQPDFGREPLEKSEIMITYDNEYLWVGARLYMQDAKKITITSKKRDDNSEFFDSFDIALDTVFQWSKMLCHSQENRYVRVVATGMHLAFYS